MNFMSRYELSKILAIRSLQLSEGDSCQVKISCPTLSTDFLFMAALELEQGLVDVCVERHGQVFHVSELILPCELKNLLDTRGGDVYTELSPSSSSVRYLSSSKSFP